MEFRERSFAPKVFEDPLQPIAETFEHRAPPGARAPETSKRQE
jgi:hypothetical protein